MLENTLRSLILEVWNIILRMYKQENEFEHSFRWKDTLPRFLYLMHTNCRYHHTVNGMPTNSTYPPMRYRPS